ncbi:hypothetical protein [Halalkalibacillus halophilus]|uniref:hypothetical protein n=1 Tax=Halalkalibacillus halophilus TaxID=392827 RepID=UPI00040749D6|nr:hypothetical protein [Halalkalibacillus halophilus]
MKLKNIAFSIVLHLFLGYLWLIFIYHVVGIANSLDQTFLIGGPLILIGTLLFFEIVRRVYPSNEYQPNHPVKLTGYVSFLLVMVIHVFIVNLI